MDLNGDGKHDWKDYADLQNINNMAKDDDKDSYGTGGTTKFELSPLGKIVIWITVAICIFALFSGAAEVIVTVLQLGAIAFFIAQWLSS